MAKIYYLPTDDIGKLRWLSNFSSKIGIYASTLGVTTQEVNGMLADYAFFWYVCDAKNQYSHFVQNLTAYKNAARSGDTLGAVPVAPTLGAAPPLVSADIFGRATALAARIKKHPGYTEAIGRDLNIIGPDAMPSDLSAVQPTLKIRLQAGHPVIGWKKRGMSGIEIHVDRGDGKGFVFLAVDTVPDYMDIAPLPSAGTAVVWKYRAIYRQADERVGQWSDEASVTVVGP